MQAEKDNRHKGRKPFGNKVLCGKVKGGKAQTCFCAEKEAGAKIQDGCREGQGSAGRDPAHSQRGYGKNER